MVAVASSFPINQVPNGLNMANPAFWSEYYLLFDVTKAVQTIGDKNSCESQCLLSNPRFRIQYAGDGAPSKDSVYLVTYKDDQPFKPLPSSSVCKPEACPKYGLYEYLPIKTPLQFSPNPWKRFEFEDTQHTQLLTVDQANATFKFRDVVEYNFDATAITAVSIANDKL